jgi:hypothetical protein
MLAWILVATSAHADPTAADRVTPRTLMDKGYELREKGDLKEALKRFKAADDIMHVPTTALPVAEVQVSLGLLVEARDTLALVRRTPEKPGDPQPFKDARAQGERLDAALAARVPALTITVNRAANGEPPAVTVDGADVPAAAMGLPRSVDPGHHAIVAKTARAEGRQEIDVREGEQSKVEITLVATGAPTRAAVEPPAPASGAPAPAAETTNTSHAPSLLTWSGVGLAGAGVVVGSLTGVLAISKEPTLNRECANHVCGPSTQSDLGSANALAAASDVAFALAGVGAVVAVLSLVVGHDGPSEPPAQSPAASAPAARPWIGLGAAGLRGTF